MAEQARSDDTTPPRTGIVLPFRRAGLPKESDDTRNADWDQLVRLAVEAWSWRDPESLETLRAAIERLRAQVLREWSA